MAIRHGHCLYLWAFGVSCQPPVLCRNRRGSNGGRRRGLFCGQRWIVPCGVVLEALAEGSAARRVHLSVCEYRSPGGSFALHRTALLGFALPEGIGAEAFRLYGEFHLVGSVWCAGERQLHGVRGVELGRNYLRSYFARALASGLCHGTRAGGWAGYGLGLFGPKISASARLLSERILH